MRSILAALVLITVIAGTAAAETSHDSSTGQSQGKERHMSLKNNIESRIAELKSHGSDRTWSNSQKFSGQRGGSAGLDLSIPARALIPDEINYRLAADFGLAVKTQNGLIDEIGVQHLAAAAKSGAYVSDVVGSDTEGDLKKYIHDVSLFGARVAQSQQILNNWLNRVGKVKKTVGAYEISGIGADDLVVLAVGAWEAAVAMGDNFVDPRIQRDYRAIYAGLSKCRLAGEGAVVCGGTVITLSAPPTLKFNGITWYGESFAGVAANYKISSSWSWSQAFEDTSGISSYEKRSSDESESTGNALEVVMSRKSAVERARHNKSSVNAARAGEK